VTRDSRQQHVSFCWRAAAATLPRPLRLLHRNCRAVACAAAAEERASGTVRVNVSTLNVRGDASTSSDVIGHARRGERLTVIGDSGDWLRVKLNDGTIGWVSSQLVVREGAGRARTTQRLPA